MLIYSGCNLAKHQVVTECRVCAECRQKIVYNFKMVFEVMNNDGNVMTNTQGNLTNTTEEQMNRLFCDVMHFENPEFDDCVILVLSYLCMSYIYINNKDKMQISKRYLTKCLELLKGKELNREAILIIMRVLDKLSYIENEKYYRN